MWLQTSNNDNTLSTMATVLQQPLSPQQKWPLTVSPTANNLLRTGCFSATDEKAKNGHCMILITNIANLLCLATLTF